jgi:glycosyltransferase involved in cell wall biosynthesis
MNPTVSVVLPTYNYGRYLAGALTSILRQTYSDLEALVIDDGSTDDTQNVVAPFLHDRRVHYHRLHNQGPAAARNFGIEQACGTWVAFLDADDLWLPTKLEKQVERFTADACTGLVYTRRLLIDGDGWQLEYEQPALHRGWVLPQLFRSNFVCFSSVAVRRDILLDAGAFDASVEHAEDYDLLLRLTQACRIDFVDEPLVLYRTGHGNLSSQTETRFRAVCGIMRRFLDGGGSSQLPRALVQRAWAETFCHWGTARRDRTMTGAAAMYARALWHRPADPQTWKAVASLFVPERLRRRMRHWLGKHVDWRVKRRRRQQIGQYGQLPAGNSPSPG